MFTQTGSLTPIPPFDFGQSLRFLDDFTPTEGEQRLDPTSLTKALMLDGQTVAFCVTSEGTVDSPRLAYTFYSKQPLDSAQIERVRDRITFFLSLEDDLRAFYTLAEGDAAFRPILEKLYGYHQVKFLTPFENACWAILSQRSPLAFGRAMKAELMAAYGGFIEVDGVTYTAFPEAGRLQHVDLEELSEVVRWQVKAERVLSAAHAFSSMDEGWLRDAPYAEVERWLRGINGIGAWSASFILIRGLGRMERLPAGEDRVHTEARKHYGDRDMNEVAAYYGDYAGYWAHYLRAAG